MRGRVGVFVHPSETEGVWRVNCMGVDRRVPHAARCACVYQGVIGCPLLLGTINSKINGTPPPNGFTCPLPIITYGYVIMGK